VDGRECRSRFICNIHEFFQVRIIVWQHESNVAVMGEMIENLYTMTYFFVNE
jgi:hypothetical protein